MIFIDQLILDEKPRVTRDGYLVAVPRVARTGIQDYAGFEVGRPDMEIVKVFRPEEEVFSKDALASFGHRPVTIDHPPVLVDAANWKKYSRGQTDGDIVRDGEFVRIPMLLMDADAIKEVNSGKVEISLGYTADIDFTPGITAKGEHYDAVQRNIRGNHLAIVDAARGGSKLRVIDNQTHEIKDMKKILVDGVTVEVSETAAEVFDKFVKEKDEEIDAKEKKLKETEDEFQLFKKKSEKEKETKDALIATLQSQLADAALTPAKLDSAVKARASVIDSAIKIKKDVVTDGKTNIEIIRQVVDAKLGETAKGWTDEQVLASFGTLTVAAPTVDAYRDAVRTNPAQTTQVTTDAAYADYCARLSNAHKSQAKGA